MIWLVSWLLNSCARSFTYICLWRGSKSCILVMGNHPVVALHTDLFFLEFSLDPRVISEAFSMRR